MQLLGEVVQKPLYLIIHVFMYFCMYYYLEFAAIVRTSKAMYCFKQPKYQTHSQAVQSLLNVTLHWDKQTRRYQIFALSACTDSVHDNIYAVYILIYTYSLKIKSKINGLKISAR